LLATSATARTGALRAWSFAGRRCAAWACSWRTWPSSETGARAKTGPCAGCRGASGTCKSARPSARGMFGAWATCVRAGSGWSAREALSRTGRSARRPAIENRFSALQSGPCRGSRWRNDGCLINRPRSRLRHHHAPWNGHDDFRCFGCRLCVDSGNRAWHSDCGSCSLRRRSGCLRRRSKCRRFSNWRNSSGGWLNSDLLVANNRSCGRLYGHASRRRRYNNNRTRGYSSSGRFGHNCACGRTRSDGRRSRRRSNDRSRRARLRNNLAWFGPGRRSSSGCCGNNRSCGGRRGGHGNFGGRSDDRCLYRSPRLARIFFLLGQQGLHHIAGLGDVR
jgi:hypothetical protein